MKTIKSEIIGDLKQDEHFEDWWESEPIQIPFFSGEKMKITFMNCEPEIDTEFIKEADEALKTFLKKTEDDRFLASGLVYKNCMEFLNAVQFDEADQSLRDINDKKEIWNFVEPRSLLVTRSHDLHEIIYINLACECEWEQEHGLQILFKKGDKLVRVSEQDGHISEPDSNENSMNNKPIIEQNNKETKLKWWEFWK
ncbi:DUF6985 domain-containing protein [Seonamhaeicola marinus]|uniref:DUF6985 domain-containing protein n=1 Tax=Seonamhaeicola marinus TaxID=1912246 RepID=UPI0016525CCD|nr:hypothetical protein [Seonamhaeicola marinus]